MQIKKILVLFILMLVPSALGASQLAIEFAATFPSGITQGSSQPIAVTLKNLLSEDVEVFLVLNISANSSVVEPGEFSLANFSELGGGYFVSKNLTVPGKTEQKFTFNLVVNPAADPDTYKFNLSVLPAENTIAFFEQGPTQIVTVSGGGGGTTIVAGTTVFVENTTTVQGLQSEIETLRRERDGLTAEVGGLKSTISSLEERSKELEANLTEGTRITGLATASPASPIVGAFVAGVVLTLVGIRILPKKIRGRRS